MGALAAPGETAFSRDENLAIAACAIAVLNVQMDRLALDLALPAGAALAAVGAVGRVPATLAARASPPAA